MLVYRLSRQCKMLEVVPSLTRRDKNCHNSRITHFYTNPHIIIFRISCATSIDAFILLHKHFISSLYRMLNFYIIKIYEQSELPVPSRTNLSCRRAGLPTLQRFRAVACSDFEIIELKQQFCGNRHRYTDQRYTNLPTQQGLMSDKNYNSKQLSMGCSDRCICSDLESSATTPSSWIGQHCSNPDIASIRKEF